MKTFTGIVKNDMPRYSTMRRIAITLDVTIDSLSAVYHNEQWYVYLNSSYTVGYS